MGARVAILTYHSLDDSGSVLSVSPRMFADQMRSLYELGWRVVPLAEVKGALESAQGEPLVAITFDDGFRSVYEHGLPILQRYRFTATVFLVTGYCGETNSWPSQPAHVEPRPLLGWAEVRELSRAGLEIGAHTRTHPNLTRLVGRDAEEEIAGSKRMIEEQIQRVVTAFAYPYGAYDETVRRLASRHFSLACSTRLGFAGPRSDVLALERVDTYYLGSSVLFRRLFSRGTRAYLRVRDIAREVRRRAGRGEGY